jgi:hypothetical protein
MPAMKGDPAMRRLTTTPVLLVLLCLCIAAIVVLGTQLVGAQPGTRTATPPSRATAGTGKATPSDNCTIGHAVPRYVQSVLLTVANDPLSVRSGHTICLAAYTLPRTKVTMDVFGKTKSGTTNGKGAIGFLFTAPHVETPTKFVYLCYVAQRQPNGTVVELPGSQRFRVIP